MACAIPSAAWVIFAVAVVVFAVAVVVLALGLVGVEVAVWRKERDDG
jgi:hypothetical protein